MECFVKTMKRFILDVLQGSEYAAELSRQTKISKMCRNYLHESEKSKIIVLF